MRAVFAPNGSPLQIVGPQNRGPHRVAWSLQIPDQPLSECGQGNQGTPPAGFTPLRAHRAKLSPSKNPDESDIVYNRVRIVEDRWWTAAARGQREYLYVYTGDYPQFDPHGTVGNWFHRVGAGMRPWCPLLSRPWTTLTPDRVETRTIQDDLGKVVSKVTRRYHTFVWGRGCGV